MTLAQGMVLLGSSGVASVIQLPVVGWFTQIGIVAGVLMKLFDVAQEPATACAATLLLVTFLSIVPVGLIWAQFEHVSLRKVAEESEHAAEDTNEPGQNQARLRVKPIQRSCVRSITSGELPRDYVRGTSIV